jgi:hypothetical protein
VPAPRNLRILADRHVVAKRASGMMSMDGAFRLRTGCPGASSFRLRLELIGSGYWCDAVGSSL